MTFNPPEELIDDICEVFESTMLSEPVEEKTKQEMRKLIRGHYLVSKRDTVEELIGGIAALLRERKP